MQHPKHYFEERLSAQPDQGFICARRKTQNKSERIVPTGSCSLAGAPLVPVTQILSQRGKTKPKRLPQKAKTKNRLPQKAKTKVLPQKAKTKHFPQKEQNNSNPYLPWDESRPFVGPPSLRTNATGVRGLPSV